jgi:N-acetylglucosaminyl-diphospho-decaprenol L-rhamnosyltransferase
VTEFAIALVNYRTPELVGRCLSAALPEGPAEVVVVDNASDDGSPALIRERHPGATVIERATNDGFAAGVNAAFAATSAPFVVVLNPDTEPRPGALRALVERLDALQDAGVAAPRLVYPDGSPQLSAYRRRPGLAMLVLELCLPLGWVVQRVPRLDPYRVPPSAWRDGAEVAHVTGAAMAIRRTAWVAAGPLDEGFFLYLEETEWQERVRRAGFSVVLVTAAEVVHLVRGGGDEALAPSRHFLASMRRYLGLRGYPRVMVDVAIAGSLALSRLAARAERLVVPAPRRTGGERAAAYDALWRDRR